MDQIATVLKTLGHTDRLRILALLSEGELTVSELVQILELSQPRVTQYIKSLEQAGIVERMREGSWVFSRLRRGQEATLAIVATTLNALPKDAAPLAEDRKRLESVRADRTRQAEAFFASVANDQGQLGDEYLPQTDIETALLELTASRTFSRMVDLGTGTGRMLKLFAPYIGSGIGIDDSAEMLRVARHTLSDAEYSHISVQQSDLNNTPLETASADLVTLHQVLHFLDAPARAVAEAARLLSTQGTLLIVDFAAHDLDHYREEYAHRRLGFTEQDMADFLRRAGFEMSDHETLAAPDFSAPDVKIWAATKQSHSARQIGATL